MKVISALVATRTGFAALAPSEGLFARRRPQSRYVLADDRDLIPVVDLEADGFPTAGFAKHVGPKARGIETLIEACVPIFESDKE